MVRPALALLPLPEVAALLMAAWWRPDPPQAGDVTMPNAMFNSVALAPFRHGQSPSTEIHPSSKEVADAAILLPATRAQSAPTRRSAARQPLPHSHSRMG
jgi:hypothetical protein